MTDPARAQLRQFVDALETYIDWCGGLHDDLCPEDDTCDCSVKWVNDGINGLVNYLREALSRLGEPEAPVPQPKVDKHKAGLYRKFNVRRTDGSDAPGGKHDQCCYFVLDLTHDPFAIPALKAYAKACRKELPNLATDLESLIDGNPLMPYRTHMPPGPRSLVQPAESPVSAREPEAPVHAKMRPAIFDPEHYPEDAAAHNLQRLLDEPKDSATIHYDEDTIPHGTCDDPVHCDCMCYACWELKADIVRTALKPAESPVSGGTEK